VGFVYYVYFVRVTDRRLADILPKIPYLIYAAIGSGIYFNNIQSASGIYFSAGAALVAGFAGFAEFRIFGPFFAIQKFREEPGGGGLAGAPRPVKKIALSETAQAGRIAQDLHVGLMSDEGREVFGAVFAVEGQSHLFKL
jgi:hypothetical protein